MYQRIVVALDGSEAAEKALPHAMGLDDLERWALSGPSRPKTVFLVHGEPGSLQGLSAGSRARFAHSHPRVVTGV